MPQTFLDIKLRSEELQEILTDPPSWLVRSGTSIIFVLIVTLISLTYIISYPDEVEGSIVLNTTDPPIKIISNSNGTLTHIYYSESDFLKPGDVIAEIENPISHEGVTYLRNIMTQVEIFLENPARGIKFSDSAYVFGNLQATYIDLKKQCNNYYEWAMDTYSKEEIRVLKEKIKQYELLTKITESQLSMEEEELENALEMYQADLKLYNDGLISKLEFFQGESGYRGQKQAFQGLKKSIIQNRIVYNDLQKQLLDLNYKYNEKQRLFKESISYSLHDIRNQITNWKKSFLISSPIAGKLTFIKSLSINQFIKAGEPIFVVIPHDKNYIGTMKVPAKGLGKVKKRQKVLVYLDQYPYQEFGSILGSVKNISEIPNDETYRIEVEINENSTSNYSKKINFKPEMSGIGKIITDDLKLIDRLVINFREILTTKQNE